MLPGNGNPSEVHQSANEVERHPGGVTVEWLCDRQIVCLTAPDAARSTIKLFFDLVEATINEWPAERPDLSILDFSSGKVVSTPYARERAQAAMALRPELAIFTAFVLPPSVQMRLFQLMSRTVFRPQSEMAVFTNRADALAWLKKKGGIEWLRAAAPERRACATMAAYRQRGRARTTWPRRIGALRGE